MKHQYNPRIASDLHTFRYHHTFARKSLRQCLVQTINITPDIVFSSKFGTHSLNGFSNYIKLNFINNYQPGCNIPNCHIMFSNIANINCNVTQSLMHTDTHTHKQTYTCRDARTHPLTAACMRAHTHTHTHTH